MALETHTLQREVCTPTTAAQTAAPYGTTPSAHTHAHIHWSTYHQTTTATATQAPTRRATKSRVPRVPLPLPFPFPFPVPFHVSVYLVGGRTKADHVGDELHATEGEDEEDTGDDHARQGDDGGDAGQVGDLLDMGCGEKLQTVREKVMGSQVW